MGNQFKFTGVIHSSPLKLLGASFLGVVCCLNSLTASDTPNIVYILADDLGYGDLGCYNKSSKLPTPRLDRLAGEGMLFTDAHSPSSDCTPTRYALLTGRYAWRTRLQRNVLGPWDKPLIAADRLTVGKLLQQHGYATACIGKWHLGQNYATTGKWIGHKGTFLEGGIRVPAIISYPAIIAPGQSRDQIVTIMDWFPSILELCGIQPDAVAPKLDGHSVVPIIQDVSHASAHNVLYFGWSNTWAVRKGDWKLIGKPNPDSNTVAHSLHNIAEPNPEVKDHASEQPDKVNELLALSSSPVPAATY